MFVAFSIFLIQNHFQYLYDSEKSKKEEDILKDIEKGVRLKHVRTNDRSKPNLRGNISFRMYILVF